MASRDGTAIGCCFSAVIWRVGSLQKTAATQAEYTKANFPSCSSVEGPDALGLLTYSLGLIQEGDRDLGYQGRAPRDHLAWKPTLLTRLWNGCMRVRGLPAQV